MPYSVPIGFSLQLVNISITWSAPGNLTLELVVLHLLIIINIYILNNENFSCPVTKSYCWKHRNLHFWNAVSDETILGWLLQFATSLAPSPAVCWRCLWLLGGAAFARPSSAPKAVKAGTLADGLKKTRKINQNKQALSHWGAICQLLHKWREILRNLH